MSFGFITFTSDYGLEDEFVGVVHGVIKRFAPKVEILDISHALPPQDVRAGAMVLQPAVAAGARRDRDGWLIAVEGRVPMSRNPAAAFRVHRQCT